MTTDELQIRALHTDWIDSVNAGDLARLLDLVAADVVFIAPGQAPFGLEHFSSHFATAHKELNIQCTSELEEIVVSGEVAYTRSRDALLVTPRPAGATARFAGYRLTVYRRECDHRWLLSRDAHTLSPVG